MPSKDPVIEQAALQYAIETDTKTICVYPEAVVDPVDDGYWVEAWVFVKASTAPSGD